MQSNSVRLNFRQFSVDFGYCNCIESMVVIFRIFEYEVVVLRGMVYGVNERNYKSFGKK